VHRSDERIEQARLANRLDHAGCDAAALHQLLIEPITQSSEHHQPGLRQSRITF
jgi:hypothetical protein